MGSSLRSADHRASMGGYCGVPLCTTKGDFSVRLPLEMTGIDGEIDQLLSMLRVWLYR